MKTLVGSTVVETERGRLIVLEFDHGEGNIGSHEIPFAALASWSELLGIDDPGEVLDAILFVAEHGEPDPDPVTGENAWTGSYFALQEREQARAATMLAAEAEGTGDDPRSPLLRGAFAAMRVADAVSDAQAATRAKLGLPEAAAKPMARLVGAASSATPLGDLKTILTTDLATVITEARQGFLDTLHPTVEAVPL